MGPLSTWQVKPWRTVTESAPVPFEAQLQCWTVRHRRLRRQHCAQTKRQMGKITCGLDPERSNADGQAPQLRHTTKIALSTARGRPWQSSSDWPSLCSKSDPECALTHFSCCAMHHATRVLVRI